MFGQLYGASERARAGGLGPAGGHGPLMRPRQGFSHWQRSASGMAPLADREPAGDASTLPATGSPASDKRPRPARLGPAGEAPRRHRDRPGETRGTPGPGQEAGPGETRQSAGGLMNGNAATSPRPRAGSEPAGDVRRGGRPSRGRPSRAGRPSRRRVRPGLVSYPDVIRPVRSRRSGRSGCSDRGESCRCRSCSCPRSRWLPAPSRRSGAAPR